MCTNLKEGQIPRRWFQIKPAFLTDLPVHNHRANKVPGSLHSECNHAQWVVWSHALRNQELGMGNGNEISSCYTPYRKYKSMSRRLLTSKLLSAKEKTPLMSSFLRMVTVAVVGASNCAPRRAAVRVTRNVWGEEGGRGRGREGEGGGGRGEGGRGRGREGKKEGRARECVALSIVAALGNLYKPLIIDSRVEGNFYSTIYAL